MKSDPVSLDPRVVQSVRDLTLMRQLYDGLMRPTAEDVANALAESVSISNDQLTYTFRLREAYWTDGERVTASDFANSWLQVLDPSFATNYAYMLYPIKNAKAAREGRCSLSAVAIATPDDQTLVVKLEKPTPYFLELTAFPTFFPVHGEFTNGPFQIDSWEFCSEMQLVKNPTYWDAEHVYLDGISLTFIDDNTTESYLFSKGELDWLGQPISNNIATELIPQFKSEGTLASYSIDGTFWFKVNVAKEPFNDPKIRKAFAYAIDRSAIIEHILGGNQSVATGPVPLSMHLHDAPYFTDGDQAYAAKLFEEALSDNMWTRDMFPPVTLTYVATERTAKIAQLVQQQWHETLGIPVELEALENHVYRSQAKLGNYQIGTGEWIADFHDPLAFLELFKSTDNGMNDTNWQSREFARLIERSSMEADPLMRQKLLLQAETLLMEAMPIIPLYHYAFDYVKRENVKDVVLSPLGTTDFKSAKVR